MLSLSTSSSSSLFQKSYSIDHEPLSRQQCVKNGKQPNGKASAYSDLQQHDVHRRPSPVSSYVPPPDYMDGDEDEDLIKPKKLVNPVKASRSHQQLHRELLSSCRRGGSGVETKPELQRVLESRKRDQLIRQRKQEEEAHRKISPLEAELLKRHMKLEELERQQEQQQEENLRAPEFVKVRENLRRTSFQGNEKEV
ncbi:protein FAM107B isoform 1-T1 [Fundulus diaphanus]